MQAVCVASAVQVMATSESQPLGVCVCVRVLWSEKQARKDKLRLRQNPFYLREAAKLRAQVWSTRTKPSQKTTFFVTPSIVVSPRNPLVGVQLCRFHFWEMTAGLALSYTAFLSLWSVLACVP